MHVCLCNNFNDKTLKQKIAARGYEPIPEESCLEIYMECSGGARPNCGTCKPVIRSEIIAHNMTVTTLKRDTGTDTKASPPDPSPV